MSSGLGIIFISLGCILSMYSFCGPTKEMYSVLNHFISELGVADFSTHAVYFNIGLMIGGTCLLIMFNYLSSLFETKIKYLLHISGSLCSVFCILVGVFPADQLQKHIAVSLPFFNLALLSSLLFVVVSIIDKGKKIPLKIGYCGLLPLFALSAFLLDRITERNKFQMSQMREALLHREFFWSLPFLEWLVFFSILIWISILCFWSFRELKKNAA